MKNIVIVGGGFAGTQVAKDLEKQLVKLKDQECRIILVEKVIHRDTSSMHTTYYYTVTIL